MKKFASVLSALHGSRRVPPFTRQRLGLPPELAHCVTPGWGQLVNVALL